MTEAFIEVKRVVADLAAGTVSREEAADWAMERIKHESARYSSDPRTWTALDHLSGADLQTGPGVYLHGRADFEAWLAQLEVDA